VKDRATAVLENMGDGFRRGPKCLDRTANEGAKPLELASYSEAYDAWFPGNVLDALKDTRRDLEESDADARFPAAASRIDGLEDEAG
jgi:DNA-damage-inducible protein J